jgi:hypothetical protein
MKIADIILQHPKLHLVTDRVKGAINLAMEKVVAHHDNPQQYPLPSDPKSLERALHNFYSKLPNRKQKKMVEKARVNMNKTTAQRTQIYGDLMAVNLKSSAPIVQQVKAIPPPANFELTPGEISALKRKIGMVAVKPKTSAAKAKTAAKVPGRRPVVPAATASATDLNFFIDSLTCNKKNEIGKDEISLAGIGIDSAGGTIELAPFFVGKFKKGETVAVGKNPFNFKLDPALFPQTFSAGLFIIETDLLHNPDVIKALLTVFTAAEIALYALGLTLLTIALAGGPVSIPLFLVALIGGLAAATAKRVVLLLADDVSEVVFDTLTFDTPVEPGKQFDRSIAIEGVFAGLQDRFDGKYQAAVHWLTK